MSKIAEIENRPTVGKELMKQKKWFSNAEYKW
jgi:hypothetical protein